MHWINWAQKSKTFTCIKNVSSLSYHHLDMKIKPKIIENSESNCKKASSTQLTFLSLIMCMNAPPRYQAKGVNFYTLTKISNTN